MPTSTIRRLGVVPIEIAGAGALARAVADDLGDLPPAAEAPAVRFELCDAGAREVLGPRTLTGLHGLDGALDPSASPPVVAVQAHRSRLDRLPASLQRAVHPGHLDGAAVAASRVEYQLLDGVVQALGLARGQSFLHAAALESGGRRVAIVAGGGMGKTGTLLRLLASGGWRYLSDDWTVLHHDGIVERSHKAIVVFPRNLAAVPGGEEHLLAGRSRLDRACWRLHRSLGGRGGLRRKATAESLFGEAGVGAQGRLDELVVVRRAEVPAIERRVIDPAEVVDAIVAGVVRELRPSLAVFGDELAAFGIVAAEVEAATRQVVAASVAAVPAAWELAVPPGVAEPAIEDRLVSELSAW